MNIGYSNSKTIDCVCPICGYDIKGSKKGMDFTCTNTSCDLNVGMQELYEQVKGIKNWYEELFLDRIESKYE